MKRNILTIIILSSILTGGLLAEEEKRKGPKGERGKARKEMVKKFDADGDGKLSTKEKAVAQADAKKRREAMDTNSDGKISKEERFAAFKKRIADDEKLATRVKARFDADSNGELSDAELTKAAATMNKRGAKGKPGEDKKNRKGKKRKKSQK